jgi:transcriptional regulator with XRE-family HTH domain
MNYGKELKKVRQAEGLTQADVAANYGMPRTNYVMIEKGQRKISFSLFLNILKSLDYDVEIKIVKKK